MIVRPIAFLMASTMMAITSVRSYMLPAIMRVGSQNLCCLSASASSFSKGSRGSSGGGRGHNHHRRTNRRHQNRRNFSPPPSVPQPGSPGRKCHRACIQIGSEVFVVKKMDQRSGKTTKGIVSRLLTKSSYHPRGIKVMLDDGTVGRVSRLSENVDDKDVTRSAKINTHMSLSDYLKENDVDEILSQILLGAANASSQVANELRLLPLTFLDYNQGGNVNIHGEVQKGMDVRANQIFKEQLQPIVLSLVSEEEDDIFS